MIEYYLTPNLNTLGDNGIHLDFKTLRSSETNKIIDLTHLNLDPNYNIKNI